MKNKIYFKRCLIKIFIVVIITILIMGFINIYQYKKYQEVYNGKLDSIIRNIEEKYPNVSDEEIFEILQDNDKNSITLKKYGITKDDVVLEENNNIFIIFFSLNLMISLITISLIIIIFLKYNSNKDKELNKITKYIQEINNKNYKLDLDDFTEDELSILKNELYKITVMLKEEAENSLRDKISIKDNLSNISHQLKTPLTSILIMLDNIIDDFDMDKDIRIGFIKDIKREILNINFLVQNILKLSKFETNTITFSSSGVLIKDIINETIKNVASLCDLKDIKIEVNNTCVNKIKCDFKWQVEALTNILKNALEYSKCGDKVEIECCENDIYTEIKIVDFGRGMDEEDRNNIFKRFYKGKNSTNDSIGIGLSLAKTIIEKDNGRISVDSKLNNGTTFIIKYFK